MLGRSLLNSAFSVLLCICFFFCLHTMYLFLSVLIVISGDVVRSTLWDKYSKISAENPECWFTPSQYKHEWTCVFCMCVFNNTTQSPNMEKHIHLKLINWLYWCILACPYCFWCINYVHTLNLVFGVCSQSDVHDWLQSSQLTGSCRFKWNVQCVFQKMLIYSYKLCFGHNEWFTFHACSEENPVGNPAKTSFWWFYKVLHS